MAIRRVISRLPDPVIGDLKSLVGQLARSRIFSPDGNTITQEQTVALCITTVSRALTAMEPEALKKEITGEIRGILDVYAEHKGA